jgi:hypothetical protein
MLCERRGRGKRSVDWRRIMAAYAGEKNGPDEIARASRNG